MRVNVSPITLLYFAVCLLFSHRLTVVAVCCAVLIHELTHLFVLWLMGGSAASLTVTPIGFSIERVGLLSHTQEIVLSLSAPMINLLLALGFGGATLDQCAVEANLGLGLLNLRPIYPLDGGKALRALLERFLSSDLASGIMQIISAIFMLILWLFSIAVCIVLNGSISTLLLVAGLFISIIHFDEAHK